MKETQRLTIPAIELELVGLDILGGHRAECERGRSQSSTCTRCI